MTTTVYNLNSIKQLIDLNGDRINFELQFKIDSTDGSPFDVLIVTQEMLDSGKELIYQKAEGTIGGNIVADQGVYQNYLLLLKSDEPTEVTVYTQIRDLPVSQQPQQPQPQQPQPQQPPQQQFQQQNVSSPINKRKKNKINWSNIILIVVGIILLAIVCWMFYKYFTKEENKNQEILDTDKLTQDISQSLVSTINEKLNNSEDNITKKLSKTVDNINEKIDGKLNNLHKEMNALPNNLSSNFDKLSGNLSELNDNISKLPNKLSDDLSELNDNISKLPDKLSGNLNDKLSGNFEKLHEQLSGNLNDKLSGNFEKLHEQFQGEIEKNNGFISEAIGTTLNKAQLSKTTDLDSIKSQLNDISVKLNNDDIQIKNPLNKSSNKKTLVDQIKNLKIPS
jgi:hypothetical protein